MNKLIDFTERLIIFVFINLLQILMIAPKVQIQSYTPINLSHQLLPHQIQTLHFLFNTQYDIVFEAFQLKHSAHLQKGKGQVAAKFKTQEIKRHFNIGSERLHVRIMRDSVDLDKLLSRLQLLWHNKNIPDFHRYYFEKYIFTAYFKNLEQLIKTQQAQVKQQTHLYYAIFRAINAREACLRQLKRNLAQLQPEDVYQYLHVAKQRMYSDKRKQQKLKYKIQGFDVKQITDQTPRLSKTKFQQFSDSFNHLTKLGLYVIQLIIKWKQYIRSLTHDQHRQRQRIEYFFYDDNYFLKILNDLGFIKASFLSNFYELAPKNDPFLFMTLLAFQKKEEITLDDQLLKRIFMPPPQLIPDILSKYEELSVQYKYNIKSRRVYDLKILKVIKSPSDLIRQKKNQNYKKIEYLQPKKSQSVGAFRVRQVQKRNNRKSQEKPQKSIQQSESNNKNSPSINKEKKMIMQIEQSPLKRYGVIVKSQKRDINEMVDSQMFEMLKEQVVKKIRKQLQEDATKNLSRNHTLQLFIDQKVKEAMIDIFHYEPQIQIKAATIEFETLSIHQNQVKNTIEGIYANQISKLSQMQKTSKQLLKIIQSLQYCYFVKATSAKKQVGKVICTFDSQIQDYKVINVIYIQFKDASELQLLMLRFVEFIWRYQNAVQTVFTFYQPTHDSNIKEVLTTLQKALSLNCLVASKNIFSNITQVRFIFKRKHKNINYIPNKFRCNIHANLHLLLSDQKIIVESSINSKIQMVSYDFLLMQVIRKYLSSDEFLILKDRIHWKNRLQQILRTIISLQKNRDIIVSISTIQAENITQLNKIQSKQNQKLLQASDLLKNNNLKLLSLKLTLTLPFSVKSVYLQNQQYHRYQILGQIQYWLRDQTQCFVFKTIQRSDLKVVLFNAKQFIKSQKKNQESLSNYVYGIIKSEPQGIKKINYLWIPMGRFPKQYHQRQETYISTFKVDDFKLIKKQILIGDQFQWFCDMQMNNAIQYDVGDSDIILENPLGIGVVGIQNTIVYARILN